MLTFTLLQRKTKNRCSGDEPQCERCTRLRRPCEYDRPDPVNGPSARLQEEVDSLRAALLHTVAALRERGHLPSDYSALEQARHVSFAESLSSNAGADASQRGDQSRKRSRGDSSASPSAGVGNSASPLSSLQYRAPAHPLSAYLSELLSSRVIPTDPRSVIQSRTASSSTKAELSVLRRKDWICPIPPCRTSLRLYTPGTPFRIHRVIGHGVNQLRRLLSATSWSSKSSRLWKQSSSSPCKFRAYPSSFTRPLTNIIDQLYHQLPSLLPHSGSSIGHLRVALEKSAMVT